MDPQADGPPQATAPSARANRWKLAAAAAAVLVALYLLGAYLVAPALWERYARRHPSLENVPGITQTDDGHPGDPLNVALIGTESDVKRAMATAGWHPADPLSLKSDVKIAEATLLDRPYDDAPVSSLFWEGRKEDLAFEQPVGDNPRKRHHVRFWRSDRLDQDDRPVWVGSATYDERVGLSRTTGQVTHHIAPDVDAERDHLLETLQKTGDLTEVYAVDGFHKDREGRNGGGDPWHTDGRLMVGVIAAGQ